MARITVSPQFDLPAIITAAGGDPNVEGVFYDGTQLHVGVPQAALDAALAAYDHRAVLQARAVAATKRIAEEKIEKFAPLWKQRNIAMRLIEFIEKGRTNLTAAEKAEAVKLRGLWLRIKSLRAASNIIETDIAAMTKTGVTTFDPAASTKWPE